jgi:hypothetical protein
MLQGMPIMTVPLSVAAAQSITLGLSTPAGAPNIAPSAAGSVR